MVLQALYRLAQRENLVEDPDYEPKRVAWLVYVSAEGELLSIVGTHYTPPAVGRKKPKPVAKIFQIPRQPGRSGTKAPPQFFVDNLLYVFGQGTEDKPVDPENGREKSASFREKVRECAEATGDPGAIAVLRFLEGVADGRVQVTLPPEVASHDQFAFVFAPDGDRLVTDREAIQGYWREQRAGETDGEGSRQCMVTGDTFAGSVPLFPLVKKVPGGSSSGTSLVGFNSPAFESHGWTQNQNAPVSRTAAEACATALNRLLDPAYPDPNQEGQVLPKRHCRLSADTVVCYWSAEERGDSFVSVLGGLLEANPEEVGELYRSLWRGKPVELADPTVFFALTLTGTRGRIIVRDWLESSVAQVADNLAAHFADLNIVRNTPPPKGGSLPPQFPMSLLVESLADPGRSRGENVPAPLAAQFVRAALAGTRYPDALLQRALIRFRAEVGNENEPKEGYRTRQWNDARAALIKAVLNRRNRMDSNWKEVQPDMDPNNQSPGYVLGCLMAVLERIQNQALGDVNATITDRYFSGASACPKAVFVRLLKNARHHVRKAKDDPKQRGSIHALDRLLDELSTPFDPKHNGFPAHLDLEQQGLFVLGYHQMRKWLWMNQEERKAWNKAHPDAPRAYLWGDKPEQVPETV